MKEELGGEVIYNVLWWRWWPVQDVPFFYYLFLFLLFIIYYLQEPTDIPSRKKLMRWVCARGLVCQKREFTVRSSSCEVMIRS